MSSAPFRACWQMGGWRYWFWSPPLPTITGWTSASSSSPPIRVRPFRRAKIPLSPSPGPPAMCVNVMTVLPLSCLMVPMWRQARSVLKRGRRRAGLKPKRWGFRRATTLICAVKRLWWGCPNFLCSVPLTRGAPGSAASGTCRALVG